ncbi:MAG: hypothetical protein ACRC46_05675 [Thermoguttaceae bacterium]
MLTFLAPKFWFAIPLVLVPLLLLRRRTAPVIRQWGAMAILAAGARQTPWWRREHDIIATIVRMTTIVAMIAFFSAPTWAPNTSPSHATTILISDNVSPHVARALETVRRQMAVENREDVASPAVVILGNTTDVELAGVENARFQRRDFASPQGVVLRAEDVNSPIVAPFATHLEKFRVTLKSVWTLASPDKNLRPIIVAEGADGERFTLISQSVTQPQIFVWHTSPEEAMSSLGTSPLFPALLDRCLDVAEGDEQFASSSVATTLWPRIAVLVLACGLLLVDARIRRSILCERRQ